MPVIGMYDNIPTPFTPIRIAFWVHVQ